MNKKIPIILLLAVILLVGAIGGVAGTIIATNNPKIRTALGFDGNQSQTVKKEKIVIEESSAVIDIADNVSPAVVSISTKTNAIDFFGQIISQEGGGSGFIITSDGLIVTNKHVISDENATYTVFTFDGKSYPAKILAEDPFQDLAILKIEASGLKVVELGNSDDLKIGQMVVAIGNALGQFQNTITTGVISAKERDIIAGDGFGNSTEKLEGLLQTDAAINQGNSGGPLVNLKGQVIGVNTAVAAKGQAEGIGFAIPVNSVIDSIDQVKKTGKIARPYLGVRYIPITKEIAKNNNLPVDEGALIIGSSVEPSIIEGSPAQKAGLKDGDIITHISSEKITEQNSLAKIISKYKIGEKVDLAIIRNKNKANLNAILEELK